LARFSSKEKLDDMIFLGTNSSKLFPHRQKQFFIFFAKFLDAQLLQNAVKNELRLFQRVW